MKVISKLPPKLSELNEKSSSSSSKLAIAFRALMTGVVLFIGAPATYVACGNIETPKLCNSNKDCSESRACVDKICVGSVKSDQEKSHESKEESTPEKTTERNNADSDGGVVTDEQEKSITEKMLDASEPNVDTNDAGSKPENEPASQPEEFSKETNKEIVAEKTPESLQEITPETTVEKTTEKVVEVAHEPTVEIQPDKSIRPNLNPGEPGYPCKDAGNCKTLINGLRACVYNVCSPDGKNAIPCKNDTDCLKAIDASVPDNKISCVANSYCAAAN